MKKVLVLLLTALLLTACGGADETQLKQAQKDLEEAKADTDRLEKLSEQIGVSTIETSDELISISVSDATEVIEYTGLGENDKLVSLSVNDGEITAAIELAPHDLLPAKDLAISLYSQASDEFLGYEGWEVLTIKYMDVGTISMDRSEKETNEYDMDYFPTMEIEKRLK